MIKSKKGQTAITIIFFTLVFVILWALALAPQLTTWGALAVINGNLTGIEALFYENINLVIGGVLLVFIVALGYFGFGRT